MSARISPRIFAIVGLLLGAAQPAAAQEAITVFAAASMKNALDDVNAAFTQSSGVKVTASYAASSALACLSCSFRLALALASSSPPSMCAAVPACSSQSVT